MTPEKLFDYLDGVLPEREKIELERQLALDPQLQRQLAMAREMHRHSKGAREVIGDAPDLEIPAPNAKLGRWLITAFAFLVLVNVLVGIAFIVGSKSSKRSELEKKELAIRQQVAASLAKTAETALPLPTFATAEIRLVAPTNEQGTLADHVITLAKQSGGTAAKAPPDEDGLTVLANIPASREEEFWQAVAPLAPAGLSSPAPRENASGNENVNVYVRITARLPSPSP
jgi:hypothetical protein